MNFILNILEEYNIPITIILAILLIVSILYNIYSKIKYDCLKQITTLIAEAEGYVELTGSQKFSLVLLWIEDALPNIFTNIFGENFLKNIIQFVYDNCYNYATNYIKRKTGFSISELVNNLFDNNNDNN